MTCDQSMFWKMTCDQRCSGRRTEGCSRHLFVLRRPHVGFPNHTHLFFYFSTRLPGLGLPGFSGLSNPAPQLRGRLSSLQPCPRLQSVPAVTSAFKKPLPASRPAADLHGHCALLTTRRSPGHAPEHISSRRSSSTPKSPVNSEKQYQPLTVYKRYAPPHGEHP